jgi:predicted nucleic-acid-binding Zn-ribbon protein
MVCIKCGSRIVNSKFCSECGEKAPAFGHITRSRFTQGTCPKCSQNDQVQNVGSIIDSGKTALTVSTIGVGTGGVGFGFGSGKSVSELSARLSSPQPKSGGCLPVLLWGLVMNALVSLIITVSNQEGAYRDVPYFGWLAAGFIPSTALVFTISFFYLGPKQLQAFSAHTANEVQLRGAYYCWRDDTVFNAEFAGTPDQFKRRVFGHN